MLKRNTKVKLGKYFILFGFILIFVYLVFSLNSKLEEKRNIDIFFSNREPAFFETEKNNTMKNINSNYIAVLEIPKIKLKKGLYSYESSFNNVDQNITILEPFSVPSKDNSIFVLASHSGNSKVSYFKNLNKLSNGDSVIIYYNEIKYYYKIIDFYSEKKNGYISMPSFKNGKYIILTTCKDSLYQLIYIGKLVKEI